MHGKCFQLIKVLHCSTVFNYARNSETILHLNDELSIYEMFANIKILHTQFTGGEKFYSLENANNENDDCLKTLLEYSFTIQSKCLVELSFFFEFYMVNIK